MVWESAIAWGDELERAGNVNVDLLLRTGRGLDTSVTALAVV